MRSESCTFIWHPKVLMHAVLVSGLARPAGFLESGMGVVCVVLLILFLRLVDAGSEGDLPRAALEPHIFDLHVPGPRRPPEYIRNARTFLLAELEHRPSAYPPTNAPPPCTLFTLPRSNHPHRPHFSTQYPLHNPHRYTQTKRESSLQQGHSPSFRLYYAVMYQGGEDAGWGSVVGGEPGSVSVCGEVCERSPEIGIRGSGGRLEGTFGEGGGVESGLNSSR